jgi:ABC-type nickel/cobalt efflux system permease component RcnA
VLTPLLIALLLGLRHATDPDHLTAVSTLLLNRPESGWRRAGILGLAWGAGHATTLFGFGLPLVLFGRYLPMPVHQLAEAAIGLIIIVLSARLLIRWRRGQFHHHAHVHGSVRHAHPHGHTHRHGTEQEVDHLHSHGHSLARTPLASFGIGLVHGVGGSAGAGVLLVGSMVGGRGAALVLLTFALATAASMAALSIGFAYLLARSPLQRRVGRLIPVLGTAGLLFGAWYSLGAFSVGRL